MKKAKAVKALGGLGITAATGYFAKKYFETVEGKRYLWDKVNDIAYGLCKGISKALPNGDSPYVFEYDNKGFMLGNDEVIFEPAENAFWSLGYAKTSLLPDDVGEGEYYLGGYLHLPPNKATDVLDDQMFRCFAVSDGSGRGIHVFGVIDCVGIANSDIRKIRLELADFIKENNILSVNISAIHSHSEIDTCGLWGDLFDALKKNPVKLINGEKDFSSGRNEQHMANLITSCAEAVKAAVADMREGKLYYSAIDGTRFVRDKRPPYVMLTDIINLHFVPADGSRGTRAVYLAAHPTQFGDDNTIVSADYPYYLCEEIEKSGENALFFQGAELAIATNRGGNVPEGLDRIGEIQEYGRAIGRYCEENSPAAEKELKPFINVKINETFLEVDNYLFTLIGKIRITTHQIVRVGDGINDYRFVSEVGLADFGGELKLALIPGELAPELLLGGCFNAEESYNHTEWTKKPMKDMVDGYLGCVGLCNDFVGYILPENDFGSVIAPLHYEEAISSGIHAGEQIVDAFETVSKYFKKK